jgi:hypothetical protein
MCLLASGCWTKVDVKSNFAIKEVCTTEVPQLKWIGEQFYINLWPENIFGLTVDVELCEMSHICAWNPVLIKSAFYPFPVCNTALPKLLCDSSTGPGTQFTPTNPDQSPSPICPHQTPVYIPTIPQYIDTCLSRHLLLAHLPEAPQFLGESGLDISYLIQYHFLEWCSVGEVTAEAPQAKERSDEGYSGLVQEDGEGKYQDTEGFWGKLRSRPPKASTDDTNWWNGCVDLCCFSFFLSAIIPNKLVCIETLMAVPLVPGLFATTSDIAGVFEHWLY